MTTTHLWTIAENKKIPVQLMTDHHLKCAYKLCWLIVYYYEEYRKGRHQMPEESIINAAEMHGFLISYEVAKKFSMIFEEEVAKRDRKFKRPDKTKLWDYIQQREDSKNFLKAQFAKIVR